jgi:pimeloyl-ACP methyl ester carboxylesterase
MTQRRHREFPSRSHDQMLTAAERWAIGETISLHGHLFDEGHLDQLEELFTADVVYDLTDVGMKPLHGIEEIRRATLELGADNPMAHHVTNIVIDLIGHSMGGLVIRSACHYASSLRPRDGHLHIGRSWTAKVRRVVLVGTPNTGAPLEVIAGLTSTVLWSLPIPATWLVGFGLDRRSAGIKDLRFGAILDEDWQGQDPGAIQRPSSHRVRPARRASYLMIAGTVSADPEHPLTQFIGDGLVTRSSATGGAREARNYVLPDATIRLFPKVTHLALASSSEVYAAIDAWWLTPPRTRSALRQPAVASDTR